ncbi:unnamed protein product, partial [Phaeothamnion confervicola]
GHFGKVLLARRRTESSSGLFAIKEVPLPTGPTAPQRLASAVNEREILSALPRHPFVVTLHETFRSDDRLFYVLDFHAGADLFEHMRRRALRPDAATTRFYAAEVVLGLEFLHTHGILYRDLKPENVLVSKTGHVCLTDFGLSKRLAENELTRTMCGTRAYLAPEMFRLRSRAGYGFSVDFWQLGCFLFELHAGRSPFWTPRRAGAHGGGGDDASAALILAGEYEFPASVDGSTREAVEMLLRSDPRERLTDWAAVRALSLFSGIDWAAAARRKLAPPVMPLPPGPGHVANFSENFVGLTPR